MFIQGIELSRLFYEEAVRPVLEDAYADLQYGAALIGPGSEVLGFDTEMSTDHHWGPRLLVFLHPADHGRYAEAAWTILSERLAPEFRGYSTHFAENPDEPGVMHFALHEPGTPVQHRVNFLILRDFLIHYTGLDLQQPLSPADWLSIPSQKLRTLTAGAVYHDSVGELTALRERLAFYPDDVWRYLLACGWYRIAQDEHLMGRAGSAGDELGSRIIGARLVRDVMQLCFLVARQYAPYPKWYGSAFARLDLAAELSPILTRALDATDWQSREAALNEAFVILARQHNALNLTDPLAETTSSFHGRPFQVMHSDRFGDALLATITDPAVQMIARHTHIGGIDQFSDSTNVKEEVRLQPAIAALYHPPAEQKRTRRQIPGG